MDLSKDAITAASNREWKKAIEINLKIIKKQSKDIDALNRLGRAYLETGQKTKASEIYTKVLRIDKFNTIAQKNLDLIKNSRMVHGKPQQLSSSTSIPVFLEEPGITKTVSLTRLGDAKIIARTRPGDSVFLAARDHCIVVQTDRNENLGRLPDDLAMRLLSFIKSGSKYSAWIKSVDSQSLKIFIKEEVRSEKFKTISPFPLTEKLTYAAFTPPELVHGNERPDVSTTEEQQDTTRTRDNSGLLNDDDDRSNLPHPSDDED